MSAGMAGVIAAHPGHEIRLDDQLWVQVCFGCPWRYRYSDGRGLEAHAAHVAEELAKAGYGNIQEAKAAVAAVERVCDNNSGEIVTVADGDHVPIYLIRAAIKNAAALADPEGHALVKAIHDRKAGA